MLLNSFPFIFIFLPVVLGLYYGVADRRALRQSVVVLASLAFYGYWNIRFVPLLVGLTLANYAIVYLFGKGFGRWLPIFGIVLNLVVLGIFKYADFLGANVSAVLGQAFKPWDILLPLGISFFVFQKISYLIDLKRGDRHIYGFLDFCLFVSFSSASSTTLSSKSRSRF